MPDHGTTSRYKGRGGRNGCRCDLCTIANTAYHQGLVARPKRALTPETHVPIEEYQQMRDHLAERLAVRARQLKGVEPLVDAIGQHRVASANAARTGNQEQLGDADRALYDALDTFAATSESTSAAGEDEFGERDQARKQRDEELRERLHKKLVGLWTEGRLSEQTRGIILTVFEEADGARAD